MNICFKQEDMERTVKVGRVDTSVRSLNLFKEAEKKMKNIIARNSNELIFATIPTMNIEKWNQTRLTQRKTSHLKHTTSYHHQQQCARNKQGHYRHEHII